MTSDAVAAAREALGRALRDFRQAAHLTQHQLAELLGYSRPRVAGAEKGESCTLLFWQGCDKVLNARGELVARFQEIEALRRQEEEEAAAAARAERAARAQQAGSHLTVLPAAVPVGQDDEVTRRLILSQSLAGDDVPGISLLAAAEAVRRELEDTLARGTVSPARMDRIEETVANHLGIYTRTAPAVALAGLLVDFMDVRRLCAERQPAMIQARLSEMAALLATLAADSLMKLGRIADARAWYGTARMAADDSGNRELRARVRAQEAMLPYYYGDPAEAIRLARDAQDILQGTPRAAGALAAAAEARALARQGNQPEADAAVTRASDLVAQVGEPDNNEAFRFGERRLLFYESSTFSNLGDSARAGRVQERALALYGDEPGLIDPALIRLDQAQLLVHDGDLANAYELTQETCDSIPPAHRTLIFAVRIRQIANALPDGHETRRALSGLHQELTLPNRLEAT
jgi:tetratricopeptide (TPR) repeat protein